MNCTSTIGIDVGGTFIRGGMVDRDGRVSDCRRCHTPRDATGESLVEAIAEIVRQIADEEGGRAAAIDGIGLALPGIVDEANRRLMRSVNLRGVEGYPLADALADRLQIPVRLMTDMQAATWAEYNVCRPSPKCFVHLRLGTGVGLCTVKDGRLERVDETRTTHHPLLVVDRGENAERCRCGLRGCLENIASARALTGIRGPGDHAAALAEIRSAWLDGHAHARNEVELAASAITKVLCNVIDAYQADHICLGGGVVAALPFLVECVVDRLSQWATKTHRAHAPTMEAARLGDQAGVIGAVLLARAASGVTVR